MTEQPFILAATGATTLHIEREDGVAWCGVRARVRTVSDHVVTKLCPKCKKAHAEAFGLPALGKRRNR